MNYEEIKLDSFTIVGISVRTSNKDGRGMKDIGELFNRFFSEQIISLIPNKVSDEFYCMYTDYESDFTGEYTTILGCKVSSTDNIPEGLISKEVPASKYHIYEATGEVHEAVGKTWSYIWGQAENIDRAYEADFDVYGKDAADPKNATVRTYLSVK